MSIFTVCGFAEPADKEPVSKDQTAKPEVGSITGKISVRGDRSPENVLVYLEQVAGDRAKVV